MADGPLRLQVFLSRNGVCSRRKAMDLVLDGHVSLNGRVVSEPSTPVTEKDAVSVDGRPVRVQRFVYLMMNKPAGYVTTKDDPHAERMVMDILPPEFRHVHPVGRLDKDTEGLLLLTNDGDLTNALTHPSFHVDKTYLVRIAGELRPAEMDRLRRGIPLEGKMTLPARLSGVRREGKGTEFLMTIREGRKRQIRLMLDACRHAVVYLQRLSQGPLKLGGLRAGAWRHLSEKEISDLKRTITEKGRVERI